MAEKIAVSIDINAPPGKVWSALTEPAQVRKYMMGATLKTDWQVGHPITWSGEARGKAYEDKGKVLAVDPPEHLSVTHWSPLSGLADERRHKGDADAGKPHRRFRRAEQAELAARPRRAQANGGSSMNRNGLYILVLVLVAILVGVGVYEYQQSQRPGVEVKVDGNGIKINSNG